MRAVRWLGIATAALGLTAGPASAATYQVGPGRSHPNLQSVQDLLNPGDVVLVDGGATYPGGAVLGRNGSPSAPITIRGVRSGSGARPAIAGGGSVANTIEVAGDHYVV